MPWLKYVFFEFWIGDEFTNTIANFLVNRIKAIADLCWNLFPLRFIFLTELHRLVIHAFQLMRHHGQHQISEIFSGVLFSHIVDAFAHIIKKIAVQIFQDQQQNLAQAGVFRDTNNFPFCQFAFFMQMAFETAVQPAYQMRFSHP